MNEDYYVFYGERFYPLGGWKDFSRKFQSLEESVDYIKTLDTCCCWAHVMHKGKVILEAEEIDCYTEPAWKFEEVENEMD
jgi:hypothetical protein